MKNTEHPNQANNRLPTGYSKEARAPDTNQEYPPSFGTINLDKVDEAESSQYSHCSKASAEFKSPMKYSANKDLSFEEDVDDDIVWVGVAECPTVGSDSLWGPSFGFFSMIELAVERTFSFVA